MEKRMESKEWTKKEQDIWWKLYLFRVPKISLEEVKVMWFLDILTGPTHCIRLLTTKHFTACDWRCITRHVDVPLLAVVAQGGGEQSAIQ